MLTHYTTSTYNCQEGPSAAAAANVSPPTATQDLPVSAPRAFCAIIAAILFPPVELRKNDVAFTGDTASAVAAELVEQGWGGTPEAARQRLYDMSHAILDAGPDHKAPYLSRTRREFLRILKLAPLASLAANTGMNIAMTWMDFLEGARYAAFGIKNPGAIRCTKWLCGQRNNQLWVPDKAMRLTEIEVTKYFDVYMTLDDYRRLNDAICDTPAYFLEDSWARALLVTGFKRYPNRPFIFEAPPELRKQISLERAELTTRLVQKLSAAVEPDVLVDIATYTAIGDAAGSANNLVKTASRSAHTKPQFCRKASARYIQYYGTAERALAELAQNLVKGVYTHSPHIASLKARIILDLKTAPDGQLAWTEQFAWATDAALKEQLVRPEQPQTALSSTNKGATN